MNIRADQVQKLCVGAQFIEQEINTIFKTFQSEILEASKNGCTRVVIGVPTNFNIVGMTNQTAQTIIYHRLIKECEDSGFSVKLSMDSSAVTYCIQWNINKNSKDLTYMRDVIATHIVVKKEDIKDAEPS
jgi:uncharacterized membrane-anchored protein